MAQLSVDPQRLTDSEVTYHQVHQGLVLVSSGACSYTLSMNLQPCFASCICTFVREGKAQSLKAEGNTLNNEKMM